MTHSVTAGWCQNHTCAHIDTILSKAHRGHMGTVSATPVVLTFSPWSRSLWKSPVRATHYTGYMPDWLLWRAVDVKSVLLTKWRILNSSVDTVSVLVFCCVSVANTLTQESHESGHTINMGKSKGQHRVMKKRWLRKDYAALRANNQKLIHCIALFSSWPKSSYEGA